jgi:putative ABC transport system ATP-binding protein
MTSHETSLDGGVAPADGPSPGVARDPARSGPTGGPSTAGASAPDGATALVTPVLRMRGVRKTFAADLAPVRALRGVDVDVAPGEFVAFMGPSGCGKSTLLNMAAGLDSVDEGTIHVTGEEITGRDEDWLARFRRRHIGIVFQFFNLLDAVSALENVVLAAVLAGVRRRAAESRARDLLDLLGLGDRAGHVPSILSGGERQRLAIARALVNEPVLLLTDEPTGALDSEGGQEVLELFRRLHARGQTIVMVTHAGEVATGAERIVRMRDGRIVSSEEGPSTDTGTGVRSRAGVGVSGEGTVTTAVGRP